MTRDPEHDPRRRPSAVACGDVGAEPVRVQLGVAPARRLRDDRGVPGPARGGDGARHVVGEHARQDDPAPPQPAAHPEVARRLLQVAGERRRAGDDVEQDVPLRAEDHQRRQPDVRAAGEADDQHDEDREEEVGREGGQELRQRLDAPRPSAGAARATRRSAPRPASPATISTTTRTSVSSPSPNACSTSRQAERVGGEPGDQPQRPDQDRGQDHEEQRIGQPSRARFAAPRGPRVGERHPQPAEGVERGGRPGRSRRAAAGSGAAASASTGPPAPREAVSSKRNLADQATSGRNSSWSYSRITISIVRIA